MTVNTNYKNLYRSEHNRMIGGVCAGIGEYLGIDPTLIRLITVLLFFAAGGAIALAYLVMLIVVPAEPVQNDVPRTS
jgi:phage shock protein PspC (stress-responsive transcriptional regulator)